MLQLTQQQGDTSAHRRATERPDARSAEASGIHAHQRDVNHCKHWRSVTTKTCYTISQPLLKSQRPCNECTAEAGSCHPAVGED